MENLSGKSFEQLIKLMAKLRSDTGCPWDREQDHVSLKKHLIEETYEVIDAIDDGNPDELKEELGDLLLQVVFHAQISRENDQFDINDVIDELVAKLLRRHPHVFGEEKAETAKDVVKTWEQAKAAEKEKRSVLAGVPRNLPALIKAYRLQEKAGKTGFDWNNIADVFSKIHEEVDELNEAISLGKGIKDELGDIFFALVNLARHLEIDPEDALNTTNGRFICRFTKMEEMSDFKLSSMSLKEMDRLWEKAKQEERENDQN